MGMILRSLIKGFGTGLLPYWKTFLPFAGSIFVLLIVFEILKEAIDISTGKGVNLFQKLVVIFFVGTVLLGYGKISQKIYKSAEDIGETVITEFGSFGKNIEESYMEGSEKYDATLKKNDDGAGFFGGLMIGIVTAILSGISLMIIFFIMILILVFIAGAYASLALILAIGPVFVAMLVSSEFRSIGVKWVLISLAYLLMIPVYIIVLKMMIQLYGQNAYSRGLLNPSSLSVSASIEQMILLTAGPMISLGLVLSVSRIIDQVIGSAGNVGETAMTAAVGTAVAAKAVLKSAKKAVSNIAGRGKLSTGRNISGNIGGGSSRSSKHKNSADGIKGKFGSIHPEHGSGKYNSKGNKKGSSGAAKSGGRLNVINPNPPRISIDKIAGGPGRDFKDE